MGCQGIVLATKGIIYKPEIIIRYILPLKLKLKSDLIKMNLKHLETVKLNLTLDHKKLNLIKLTNLKLNQKLTNNLKLNLKKCED
jgi:hypothetical protein